MVPLVNEGLAVSVVRGQVQPVGNRKHFVLALGGFDPSCGAGVQADLRTFEAMGVAGVTVVTQPNFVAERGDQYLVDVPAAQHHELWRVATLTRAGVPVALSTDAPFGDADPWAAMRAAADGGATARGGLVEQGDRPSSEGRTVDGRPLVRSDADRT